MNSSTDIDASANDAAAVAKKPKSSRSKMRTRDLTLCALFVALIAVGAFIRIPIPYIPITLQDTFVLLAGILLGKRNGAIACAVYLVLGLAGLPIFTQGGGIWYLTQPTFGYIIGFVFGAWLTGAIVESHPDPSFKTIVLAWLAGLAVIYACGLVYFYCIQSFYLDSGMTIWTVLFYGFLTCIPGDLVMTFIGSYLGKRLLAVDAIRPQR